MNYTKGEWRVIPLTQPGWRHLVASDESLIEVAKIYLRGKNPDVESLANAHLIAAAPLIHGQLETGIEALTKALAHLSIGEIMEARDYIKGVIAGNQLALAKAEGKEVRK